MSSTDPQQPPPASPAAPPAEAPRPRPNVLKLWFGFSERVERVPYLLTGVALMAVKYAVDAGLVYAVTERFFSPLDYLNPVLATRFKATELAATETGGQASSPQWLLIAMAVFALPFLWIGLSMSIRRAIDAGVSPWLALTLYFIPGVNYVMMLVLAALPSKSSAALTWPLSAPPVVIDARLRSGLLGVVVGLGIAAAMSALSIYALGSYGASLFLGTPLLMGAAAGFLHNRGHARAMGETVIVALLSVALAGACLLLFALEGVLCLAMAFPIAAGLGVLGAIVGRAIAIGTGSPTSHVVGAALLLPMLCGAEVALDTELPLHEVETARVIDAPPEVVWQNVVSFTELPPPAEWFFDAGIAYPLRAHIDGSGVGAVRHCEFSTGPFVEPITVWDEPRRLAFDVTAQPKPMKEWSPYAFVNAPHLDHSIVSRRGEFRLISVDDGKRTLLKGSTWYTLDMAPNAYWRLWAEALLHSIHGRVLDHIAQLSEADRAP